ncbi:unnamed protein product [Sphagnum troendelagicum]|uniref:HVA22-like protein n=1 Tax=Sphagnum troendelagicum TaxID=128251 RepID=A0ABP0TGM2_9BRYO
MMGSFLTRGIIMLLGYVYPAYECFKIVERKKPDLEHLRFWCQYWIIIAVLTVSERVGDVLVSWVPMYSEAKLAFFIYLWYPRSKGTTCVYTTFLQPFVSRHELDIDQNLNELRTRAGEMAVMWWQRGSVYAQAHFYELLDYMTSQSNRAHPTISPPVHPGNAPQTPCEPTQVSPQEGNQVHPPPPPPPPGHPQPGSGGTLYPAVSDPPRALPGAGLSAGPRSYPPAPGQYPLGPTLRRAGSHAMVPGEDEPEYDVVERRSQCLVPPTGEQELPSPAFNTRNCHGNACNC